MKQDIHDKDVAEQMTGCDGAGSWLEFAQKNGYIHVETLNWSSSAGDWQFIVSKDGKHWQILDQTNNYPRPGFSHEVDNLLFDGTKDEALEFFSNC